MVLNVAVHSALDEAVLLCMETAMDGGHPLSVIPQHGIYSMAFAMDTNASKCWGGTRTTLQSDQNDENVENNKLYINLLRQHLQIRYQTQQ